MKMEKTLYFELGFSMANTVFDCMPEQEVKRILLEVAQKVEQGVARTIIRDVNGNKVGGWEVTCR